MKNKACKEEIIKLLKQGLLHKNIAERFGISRVWVSVIAKKAGIKRVKRERNSVLNEWITKSLKVKKKGSFCLTGNPLPV